MKRHSPPPGTFHVNAYGTRDARATTASSRPALSNRKRPSPATLSHIARDEARYPEIESGPLVAHRKHEQAGDGGVELKERPACQLGGDVVERVHRLAEIDTLARPVELGVGDDRHERIAGRAPAVDQVRRDQDDRHAGRERREPQSAAAIVTLYDGQDGAGTRNDTEVIRVRHARRPTTPASTAFLRPGSCESLSRLQVAKTRMHVNVSSRQPSGAQLTAS